MNTIRVKEAKIDISVRGCIDCGTEYSFDWKPAKTVSVVIAGKERELTIYRCGDCLNKTHQQALELR